MTTPSDSDTALRVALARRIAKDGVVFLGLAYLAGLISLGAAFVFSADSHERLPVLGLSVTCSFVLALFGLWKFLVSRKTGIKSALNSFGPVAAWLYCVWLAIGIFGYALPRLLQWNLQNSALLTILSAVFLGIGLPLVWGMVRSDTPAQRSCYAIVGSLMCLLYTWALLYAPDCHVLIYGLQESLRRDFWDDVRPVAWSCIFAALMVSIPLLIFGLQELRSAGRTRSNRWIRGGAWLYVGMLAITGACFMPIRLATYWGFAAAILLTALALALGSILAHLRQRGGISFKRRALFTAPLLMLTLPLIIAAGIAGSVCALSRANFSKSYSPQGDWVWHLPELVRAPIARLIALESEEATYGVYINGLVSNSEVQAQALGTASQSFRSWQWAVVWNSWCERDPAAVLAAANSVPPVVSVAATATDYDEGAGLALGKIGSDEDVRAHLNGTYSKKLVNGMLDALTPARTTRLQPELVQYMSSYAFSPLNQEAWVWFVRRLPVEAEVVVLKKLDAPSADTTELFMSVLQTGAISQKMIEKALVSSDVMIRKCMLQFYNVPFDGRRIAQHMLAAAKGRLPNADADERRAGAQRLQRLFHIPDVSPEPNYQLIPPPPLTPEDLLRSFQLNPSTVNRIEPLSTEDAANIDRICNFAEDWLAKHPDEEPQE